MRSSSVTHISNQERNRLIKIHVSSQSLQGSKQWHSSRRDTISLTINILTWYYTAFMFLCGVVNQLKVVRVPTNLFSCFVHFKIFPKFSVECMFFLSQMNVAVSNTKLLYFFLVNCKLSTELLNQCEMHKKLKGK